MDSFKEFKAGDLGELPGQMSHFINKESEALRIEMLAQIYNL